MPSHWRHIDVHGGNYLPNFTTLIENDHLHFDVVSIFSSLDNAVKY